MSDVPTQPEGFPAVNPYLCVADVDRASEFYQRAFGFNEATRIRTESGELVHVSLDFNGSRIMIGIEDVSNDGEAPLGRTPQSLGGTPVVLYVFCDDVDALWEQASEEGAIGTPPRDEVWGDRACMLFDPDGHAWNFATHIPPYNEAETSLD